MRQSRPTKKVRIGYQAATVAARFQLPGTFCGSRDQVAIEAYLESLKERGEPIPPQIDEEVVEVAI